MSREIPDARAPRQRKHPRPLTLQALEDAAVNHLGRYASSVAQLRRVLARKVERSLRAQGGDREQASSWVAAVVDKAVRAGLVNDRTYAESRARSLRASGRSGRSIAVRLRAKGVAPDLVQRSVAEASADVSEAAAARIWARKKRLGPFRADPDARKLNRQRDLAALARAGFSFAIARALIDEPAAKR